MQYTLKIKTKVAVFLLLSVCLIYTKTEAQNVAVTDDDSYVAHTSAMLDVKSTTKGLLIPRVTSVQRGAISSPQTGLLVFDTDAKAFYYWDGLSWINLSKGQIWTVNSDYVFLTDVNDRVGIGTNTPKSKLEVKADDSFTADDTLFVVKDKNGYPVFAVFPDGAKVYVDANTKGKVGGFAVSGRTPTKYGEESYLHVTPDSTRIYVNDTATTKGTVGGFAISGRTPTKGSVYNYFVVNGDSARIYINDTVGTKGKVGGFAISGRTPTKGFTNNYMEVTADSTRIYVPDSTLSKGKVGGFAISGRTPTKGIINDYFNVSTSSDAEKINNESRIVWYPTKAALLAGEVHVGSADSVGRNSMALGYRTISKGNYSQAMGYESEAYGEYSTAIGRQALALGNSSFSFGYSAQSKAQDSYTFGAGAIAEGIGSYAIGSVDRDSLGNTTGEPTKATGNYSFALGLGTRADSTNAFAFGSKTWAAGLGSTAFGYESVASQRYTIAGGFNNIAYGRSAIAIGENNIARMFSVAMGVDNWADASGTFSIGYANDITEWGPGSMLLGHYNGCGQIGSYAFGYGNHMYLASPTTYQNSMALGFNNEVMNSYAFAIGHNTIASGVASMSIGTSSKASGSYSISMGQGIETSGNYSFGIALSNQTGTNVTQANTMAIMGGKVGIGTVTPDAQLKLGTGGFAIGSESSIHDTLGMSRTIQLSTQRYINGGNYDNHTGALIWSTLESGWGDARLKIALATGWATYNTTTPAMIIGQNFLDGATLAFRTNNTERMIINTSGNIGIGTSSPNVKLDINGGFALRQTTPATITKATNDYNIGQGSYFRISSSATYSITGLTGGTDGKVIILTNVGSNQINLINQSGLSNVVNQFLFSTGSNISLLQNNSITLIYDSVTQKWRDIAYR